VKRRASYVVLVLVLAACGRVPSNDTKGQPPGQSVLSASGRVKGGRYTMDVQLGQPVQAAPASGGAIAIEPAAR
jgi:hypothetical protein